MCQVFIKSRSVIEDHLTDLQTFKIEYLIDVLLSEIA